MCRQKKNIIVEIMSMSLSVHLFQLEKCQGDADVI